MLNVIDEKNDEKQAEALQFKTTELKQLENNFHRIN